MNKFVSAVRADASNAVARTENGMRALATSADAVCDLFYKAGALRGKDITNPFVKALAEDKELALRTALWLRDVRGGAGERQLFRDILKYLEKSDPDACLALLMKAPEVGRWDDLLEIKNDKRIEQVALTMIKQALEAGNGLAAKWMPRKGEDAVRLRNFLGFSPKQYRKTLVSMTNVVETAMCSGNWEGINFEHVPSLAASRYQKAFLRHSKNYAAYKAALVKGEAKINASAVYPYDVVKACRHGDAGVASAQWDALPNYMGSEKVLAVVDVSGSMCSPIGTSGIQAIDVALSLGLYCADKNTGAFKDTFLTFSETPQLLHLKGKLHEKLNQMNSSTWGMNTNLHKAFELILKTAVTHNVPQKDMPSMILILSDMQFDACCRFDDSANTMIKRKYMEAGYKVPNVVFWNIRDGGNVPVKFNSAGVALVSGFSPAIMTSILAGKHFTPVAIMLETIMKERYNPELEMVDARVKRLLGKRRVYKAPVKKIVAKTAPAGEANTVKFAAPKKSRKAAKK